MKKVQISQNFVMPDFQTVNKNEQSTQLILMDPQNGSLYLLHQYLCCDSQDYRQLITLLQTQASQGEQCQYILNPVVYLPIKYTDQQFATTHFVQVLYEYGSHTLQQQLYLRMHQKQNNLFQEHEIWSIFGSCVLALKYLKDRQFTHSSICLNDIFVTKDGQIKLCHPMVRTYDHGYSQEVEQGYFQRALSQNYYFSPQQLPCNKVNPCQRRGQLTPDGLFKSDIFSLAMAVVSLCVLSPITDCYLTISDCFLRKATRNKYKLIVDSKRLQQYFYSLEQFQYSHELISLLFSMLTYQASERISIHQLSQIIDEMIRRKHQEQQLRQSIKEEGDQQYEDNLCDQRESRFQRSQLQACKDQGQKNWGKFSRVSQASPISGRSNNKNRRSRYQNSSRPFQTLQNQPDLQDRPSSKVIQCENDCQTMDKASEQGQQQYNQIGQNMIDQTLNQYINNNNSNSNDDSSLNLSVVNRTLVCQNQRIYKNHNTFSPQQVVSILMTSKQLGSLPDESSIVVGKNIIYRSIKQQKQEQNQMNKCNVVASNNYQGDIFENHRQTLCEISSARGYNQQLKKQRAFANYSNNRQIKTQSNHIKNQQKSSQKNSFSISLNKNYDKLMQNQSKDPNNIYTDPLFLQAIRDDVDKILNKRKMQSIGQSDLCQILYNQTNTLNSQILGGKQTNFKQATNQIYINGNKVNNLRNQPLKYFTKVQVPQQLITNLINLR